MYTFFIRIKLTLDNNKKMGIRISYYRTGIFGEGGETVFQESYLSCFLFCIGVNANRNLYATPMAS